MYRIMAIGAHPDDCELRVGGTAVQWARAGFAVQFVSVANGDAGHHEMKGEALASRRRAEAAAAARIAGAQSLVLDFHDGEVIPSLDARRELIRTIRRFQPDLILTHRPNDYHPDHRYTSQLVQDCCFMVTVPNICPDTPAMRANPAAMYVADHFRKPIPFQPDVVVDVEPVLEEKLAMLAAHESQMAEWLPWLAGELEKVQSSAQARRDFLICKIVQRNSPMHGCEELLLRQFGPERALTVRYVESFEICEYGAPMDESALRRFFPFAFASGDQGGSEG